MSGLCYDLLPRLREDLEEAVLDSELWPDLLARAARASGSADAMLLRVEGAVTGAIATPSGVDLKRRYFGEGWCREDHRFRGLPRLRTRGIAVDQDFTSPDEFERLPYYQDLLAPYGLRWFAGIGFEAQGLVWCLALQRSPRQGPFEPHEQEPLAAFAPLLRRAALLTQMVEKARLAGLIQAFDLIDRAALLLDADGRALQWNAAFGALLGPHLTLSGGRLAARDPEAARRLEILARPTGRPAVSAVAVPREDRAPLAIRVIPLVGPGRAVFAGASTLVLASAPESAPVPEAALLQAAYRLTPAEARLVQALSGGATLAEAAQSFAVSGETARSHLKAVFAKTGTARQSDLVRLVAALAR